VFEVSALKNVVPRLPEWARELIQKATNFVARKRFNVPWISRQEMHSESGVVVEFAKRVLGAGVSNSATKKLPIALLNVVESWNSGAISHQAATEACEDIATGVNVSKTNMAALQNIERLCQNFGLHRGAGFFALKVRERVILEARLFQTPTALEREFVSAVHWGDLTAAETVLQRLRSHRLNSRQRSRFERYEAYFRTWAGMDQLPLSEIAKSQFFSAISGKSLLIYGPGEVDGELFDAERFEIVARTCGPGKCVFDSQDDLVSNKTDVVYVNPEDFDLGEALLRADRVHSLSQYAFVVTKRKGVEGLSNNRVAVNVGALFLRGHPNKGTQMILDLLVHNPRELHVIGMSFFLAHNAYREDARPLNTLVLQSGGEQKSDLSGSEGGRYDLNWQYASHNLRENFGLVRNLYSAGKITGDAKFSSVMSYSIDEYLAELDAVAGTSRL
jgi:hypothetical protein